MLKQINFVPGDIIRVYEKIKEENPSAGSASSGQAKSRIQVFEGTVLAIKGRGENKSFTVMKIVADVGVEKIFPLKSPNVEKIEIKEHAKKKIRRAKLYYLRLPKPI